MFFIEVFERVHRDRESEYLKLSRDNDIIVKETEPGMLVHVQTRVAEDDISVTYRWQETYADVDAFRHHGQTPNVRLHMEKLAEGILVDPISVVVYCDWPPIRKQKWLERTENLSFADLASGYLRE